MGAAVLRGGRAGGGRIAVVEVVVEERWARCDSWWRFAWRWAKRGEGRGEELLFRAKEREKGIDWIGGGGCFAKRMALMGVKCKIV